MYVLDCVTTMLMIMSASVLHMCWSVLIPLSLSFLCLPLDDVVVFLLLYGASGVEVRPCAGVTGCSVPRWFRGNSDDTLFTSSLAFPFALCLLGWLVSERVWRAFLSGVFRVFAVSSSGGLTLAGESASRYLVGVEILPCPVMVVFFSWLWS